VWKCAADAGRECGSDRTGDRAREGGSDGAVSLSIRAFSMLKLTLRLWICSGVSEVSNIERASGVCRLDTNDALRRSASAPRLAGRAGWLGENGREGLAIDRSCVTCSSKEPTCFWRLWIAESFSKTVFSNARICDDAAERSNACCWRRELIISPSREPEPSGWLDELMVSRST